MGVRVLASHTRQHRRTCVRVSRRRQSSPASSARFRVVRRLEQHAVQERNVACHAVNAAAIVPVLGPAISLATLLFIVRIGTRGFFFLLSVTRER